MSAPELVTAVEHLAGRRLRRERDADDLADQLRGW